VSNIGLNFSSHRPQAQLSEIQIQAADGHTFQATVARRIDNKHQGALLVLPEVFGFTDYIKDVCLRFADSGYLALTPSLLDRVGVQASFPYDKEQEAYHATTQVLPVDDGIRDIEAGLNYLQTESPDLPRALVGYSYGATLGWLASSQTSKTLCFFAGFYGSRIALHTDRIPLCPYHLYFGEGDVHLSPERRSALQTLPDGNITFYQSAGHGFDCSHRPSDFVKDVSQQAFQHVLSKLEQFRKS
jgi:dienelactone hydrolase